MAASEVLRALWHVDGKPLSEDDSIAIEKWIEDRKVGDAPKEDSTDFLALPDGKNFVEYQDSSDSYVVYGSGLGVYLGQRSQLDRGWADAPDEFGDSTVPISDLVFCIHGMGEHFWSQPPHQSTGSPGAFVESVREFRSLINKGRSDGDGRIECIPVVWANIIHEDDRDLVGRIKDITLRSVPLLRSLANDVAADVMFYQSPIYESKIRRGVIGSINTALTECMATIDQRGHPRPRVSILGHSLGSVIAYDIVKIQENNDLPTEFRLTSGFDVHVLFLCGSPLPLFLTCRGVARGDIAPVSNCCRLYNVFNPTDPVAYRIEPLIAPDCKAVNAHHVPFYSGGGGIQRHVQVKRFAESAFEVGVTNTLMRPVKNLLGFDSAEKKKYSEVVKKIKKANRGERIDWVLQDSFIESAGEYVAAVASHCKYFGNPDFAFFVRDKINDEYHSSADESDSIEPAETSVSIVK
ncbi:phospholipase ddhd1, putative [Perkinsus marinus ATCC 50983]|uniref:Phospholipase ddhd1, putative n=1 Tax=Perkinsus marinus (strain ATCC 50983 / TXsc) TaxID=423536 RepID=C5KXH2_PERM5|nr:phospholipase ddhd1, putative [Perkinsus marinus ATCC 50983]EER10696.1 phospholipase ddhd1, putative [Perkinsus marinus ATCC 50983]|eukprot:XP_002778901.1 phospholipase ddhd1, putative [Perkinsus marinus ATCC 50983]